MHFNSMNDLTADFPIEQLIANADRMVDLARRNTCDKQLPLSKAVLLFMEASTRTQYSTQQAAMNLGMRHTMVSGTEHTSVMKGESFADTFRMFAGQGARILALRTKIEGAPLFAARVCQQYINDISVINPGPVSIINCGDGRQWHPTQTVLDMLTIQRTLGRLENFTLGIMGDLGKGRTSHTLLQAFRNRPEMKFVFVSPKGFEMPVRYKHGLTNVTESDSLTALAKCDVVYVTRFQLERMSEEERMFIQSVWPLYVIDQKVLNSWQPNILIMHPLPRKGEIAPEVSLDKRIIAFKQAEYGIPARMAIIMWLCENRFVPLALNPEPIRLLAGEASTSVDHGKQPKHFQPVSCGTVIDHIPPGQIGTVFHILETCRSLPDDLPRQAVQYVKSAKYQNRRKDVLLLHDFDITDLAAACIQATFPQATVNYLPGNETIRKRRFSVPPLLTENVHCINEACITNHDREATPRFVFLGQSGEPHLAACEYCGQPLWD